MTYWIGLVNGLIVGWWLHYLLIDRHVARTLRLVDDAILEQDLARAGRLLDKAEAQVELLL